MTFESSEHRSTDRPSKDLNEHEVHEIGVEAYHYLFPLIMMDITRRVMTNSEAGAGPGLGPMNAFSHLPAFPSADRREVVRPNFDTLYSSAWLDLTEEPMIVSAPNTAERFFMLPMMDMWTDVLASPGRRTSGTGGGHWAIVPPGWGGSLPEGVERIVATTPYVWIIGRTQTNSSRDFEAVHRIQDGYTVTPLSLWGKSTGGVKAPIDPTVDMSRPPIVQVTAMPATEYFSYGAELMKLHSPHATDWSQLARLKRIGIEPGKSFDFDATPPAIKVGLERASKIGLKQMKAMSGRIAPIVNGWQILTGNIGVYGNDYRKRAIIAMIALGTNQPEDAIYPLCVADLEGRPPEGSRKYSLYFPKDRLPPVNSFWSVTLYDQDGFAVPNPENRYILGDRDNLRPNTDGSLTIIVQSEPPNVEWQDNWLPSPARGRFSLTMRLYEPRHPVLDGRWTPPPLTPIPDGLVKGDRLPPEKVPNL